MTDSTSSAAGRWPRPPRARTTARPARRLGRRAEVGPSLVVPVVAVDGGGDRVAFEDALPEPLGEVGDSGVGISVGHETGLLGLVDECRASVARSGVSEQIGQQAGGVASSWS